MTSDELRARRLRRKAGIVDAGTPSRAPVIRVHHRLTAIEIAVSGELGTYASTVFDEVLSDIGSDHHVDVECSEVDVMDPAFLAVVVHHWQRLREGGGALEIINASPATRQVVQLSGLEHLLLDDD